MLDLSITLNDDNNGIYYPGQTIHGSASIKLSQDKKINELFVLIRGVAKCHWRSYVILFGNIDYYGKKVLLNIKVTFFSGGKMSAGSHDFKFECALPSQLPGSYETSRGSIAYKVVLKADIPWAIDDELKQKFTVVRHEDLNLQSNAFLSIKNEIIRPMCIFKPLKMKCGNEPCSLTVFIPQSGYVPGQVLRYSVEFHSKSDPSIVNTRAALRQVITYYSDSPLSNVLVDPSRLTSYQTFRLIKNYDCYSYEGEIQIPRGLHPTNTHCCGVLRVSYVFVIKAEIGGVTATVTMQTPIIIGTIPITNENRLTRQSPPTIASLQTTSELHPHDSGQPGQYNEYVNPTFDETQPKSGNVNATKMGEKDVIDD